MNVKNTLSTNLKRDFEVTISAADIEADLLTQLETIGKKAKISGFRPGKIPLPLLKQRYQDSALKEVLEVSVDKAIKKVVKDNDLRPALQPKVTVTSYEEGKDLVLTINIEILPVVGDIDLKGLSFDKYVVTIPSKQLDEALQGIAKQHRTSNSLKKDRKSQKGDVVVIDFKGFIDGTPIAGGEGHDYSLELGSNSFIPGFEDQLIGHDKGAAVEVKVAFPKEYHEANYAGKAAHFDVTIKDIHTLDPADIDEKLAEKVGFESLKAMKEAVEKNFAHEYTAQSFLNTKRQVFDAMAEKFSFEIPEGMIELEFNNIWATLLNELGIDQGKSANKDGKTFEEATGKSEAELRKDYRVIAERRVRLGIVVAELGNREKISVSQKELMDAVIERARAFPGQEQKVVDFYRNTPSAMDSLRAPIFENKVVEFILEKSKIKEIPVTPEELEKKLLSEEEAAGKRISAAGKTEKK